MSFDLSDIVATALRVVAPRLDPVVSQVLGDACAAAVAAAITIAQARGRLTPDQVRHLVVELVDDALDGLPGWRDVGEGQRDEVIGAVSTVADLLRALPPTRRRVRMRADVVQALAGDAGALISRLREARVT